MTAALAMFPTKSQAPLHSIQAERAALASILVHENGFDTLAEILRPDYFALPEHQDIFTAAAKVAAAGETINPVILERALREQGRLENVDGVQYLWDLADEACGEIITRSYVNLIRDLYTRRQLIEIADEIYVEARESDVDETADMVRERIEGKLFSLSETGASENAAVPFETSVHGALEAIEAAYKNKGEVTGVPTGLADLDAKLGGLHPSDLLILAGRPSMGKTACALNLTHNAAMAGVGVGFFSLEMSDEQLAMRQIATASGVSSHDLRKGQVDQEQLRRAVEAATEIRSLPIYIDDSAALSISALRTRARKMKRKYGIGLLVVDYLQLLAGNAKLVGQRVQEISEITRGLKGIAKDLDIPVLALSQLSRAVEQREDKRPQLSDLRDSGTIEQDADVVMFIYRDEYYLERAKPVQRDGEDGGKFLDRQIAWDKRMDAARNVAEITIAKQRHGPIGTVELQFDATLTKFSNLERKGNGF